MDAQAIKAMDIHWQFDAVNELDDKSYQQWCALLQQRTGIIMSDTRRSFIVSQLNIRMRELGYHSYQEYYDFITGGHLGRIEWETLVDRLTVHETRFFRESLVLPVIRKELLDNHNAITSSTRKLHVWSVGCATGEEPYSLMMYMDKALSLKKQPYYLAVTASDISSAALAKGRAGIYNKTRIKNLPQMYVDNYMHKVDENHFRVNDDLRRRVCFNQINIVQLDNASVGMMDLIVCQNVLIYFKREQRIEILDSLVKHLNPGGLLIIGAGEVLDWKNPLLQPVTHQGVLAYRRSQYSEESKA